MILKLIIASLSEVDEKYRDLYTAKEDKFVFTGVEGIKTEADILAINKALIAERAAHGDTKAKLKTATDAVTAFGEFTPEKIQEITDKLATLEAAGTPDLAKNFEKIVGERVTANIEVKVKTATDKLNKQIADLLAAQATLQTENGTLKLAETHRTIDDAVRGAAVKAAMLPGAMVDALIRARGVFEVQEGKVVTKDGLTPEDWTEQRKADAGHWWPVSKGAGGTGSDGQGNFNSGDNPWATKNWNVTKQSALVRENPTKAAQLAEQAGSKVGAIAPTKV